MANLITEWTQYHRTGDADVRESLILHCMPLVRYVVAKFVSGIPNDLERDDLIHSGVSGAIDAIERFDPTREMKFESYAIMRIRGAVLDELRAHSFNPRTLRRRVRRAEQIRRSLRERYRGTSAEKHIDELFEGGDPDGARLVGFVSLHDPAAGPSENGGMLISDELVDAASPTVIEQAEMAEAKVALGDAVENLPDYDREVITLYYREGMMIKDIGKRFGVTESRISQVHGRALKRLRTVLKSHA